ncbi:uncharacterized protein EI97DRAFT_123601 [Westerdykella ornata]|uniref:DUF7730 domain-containing protein n=1 Tax=Westerdykella ornata TaxID=318751 RepID=A0A6A6JV09_WESOR|nr:uncharacterized protein EI97DRAFT_123601 [Westerdykella ornata]KAF2280451.1 hypothetical protein EI97DRAFT_123601 [Westerdykella ornata]
MWHSSSAALTWIFPHPPTHSHVDFTHTRSKMLQHQADQNAQKKLFPLVRNKLRKRSRYTACWPLLENPEKIPQIHPQDQSPLFNKLRPELRLLVYRELLVDQSVFTHIIHLQKGTGRIVHRRCFENDSPYPTWQHKCYLDWQPSGYSLLAILKTYAEALHLLYEENTFHFKGALGLLKWASVIPEPQWTCLRRIHITSLFEGITIDVARWRQYPYPPLGKYPYPPDIQDDWKACCDRLRSLPHLRHLRFDLILRGELWWQLTPRVQATTFISVLRPLQSICADKIEVELNVEVPQSVWDVLGNVNFTVITRWRPFNDQYVV